MNVGNECPNECDGNKGNESTNLRVKMQFNVCLIIGNHPVCY
jgi:hypothetical protein